MSLRTVGFNIPVPGRLLNVCTCAGHASGACLSLR